MVVLDAECPAVVFDFGVVRYSVQNNRRDMRSRSAWPGDVVVIKQTVAGGNDRPPPRPVEMLRGLRDSFSPGMRLIVEGLGIVFILIVESKL